MEGFINVSPNELNLSLTLVCGQCFRWKRRKQDDNVWFGVILDKVFELNQKILKTGSKPESRIHWKLLNPSFAGGSKTKRRKLSSNDVTDLLSDYFQLKVPLVDYYSKWSSIDDNFSSKGSQLPGIRILRQDPVENLFSFICSSNNNIPRISMMVEALCSTYGQQLFEDSEYGPIYGFPTINALAVDAVESKLRSLNFGYRAKFISQTAKSIVSYNKSEPSKWLYDLRNESYEDAHSKLMTLPGVGAKVADCVCLMSLDKHDAIPDTHVWKIAINDYMPHMKKNKTMTDKAYKEVGNFFRSHFGPYSGWAHSVLFTADLSKFKKLIK
ncbi:N-glycosylase/DNA lyase isoform X2 [Tetranychus urticae]|uniref:N-glycosylase/DNA lyase isoform X2 n=1 Tax=Tetranychus urticae TaxID=32264 RepID=UPI000D6446F1|nr:N-glycosylase/DNA lyase isoform X2 [Tetranychus urticae]